ncbi:MAG: PqqD family protein [Chloroflexi bacterium]|nr:MAG: PqqD family protein [Chloroflexota bacterium]
MNLQDKPQQKPGYRLEALDDELLLYHPGRTAIIYCNATASLVWQLCDGNRTIGEMIDLLSAAYEQPAEVIKADVFSVLEEFCRHGAVQIGQNNATRKSG